MDPHASPEGGFTFLLAVVLTVAFSTWAFFFSIPSLMGQTASLHPGEAVQHVSSATTQQHSSLGSFPTVK